MKHIVQFSGGKDSTAMLLMMLERNMPIDEIVFCDTGKEFPQMYEHIKKVEGYIGRKVTVLKAEKSFDYYFAEHAKTKGKNIGSKGYGWARMWVRWCTRLLKQEPTNKYLREIGVDHYISYIGIAADEPKRHKNITQNTEHPLFDWGVTEAQALQYCYDKGFDWNGMYEQFRRVSCWCCPLQRLSELRTLRAHYPELWQELIDMDNRVEYKFKPDYSVEQLDRRFALEDAQENLFKERLNEQKEKTQKSVEKNL